MRITILIALMLIIGGWTAPASADCEGKKQQEINDFAEEEASSKDAELNSAYKRLLAIAKKGDSQDEVVKTAGMNYVDGGYEKPVRDSQRAWIKFRDANCTMKSLTDLGGSMRPFDVSNCKIDMTIARTKELNDEYNEIADRLGVPRH